MHVGVHLAGKDTYVLLYAPHPDVFVAFPPPEKDKAVHEANASYYLQGHKGISIYRLREQAEMKNTEISRTVRYKPYDKKERKKVYDKYSIEVQVKKHVPQKILDVIARDVERYAYEKDIEPKRFIGSGITKVEELVPNTKQETWGELKFDRFGKQDYTRQCWNDVNIDFTHKSCVSNMVDGYFDPFGRCFYCYGKGKQTNVPIKKIYAADLETLLESGREQKAKRKEEGKRTKYARFGKISEAGSKFTREQLLTALEACEILGWTPIFPTKYLEFDKMVSSRLLSTGGRALWSVTGRDEWEPGAVSHGCTNEMRREEAVRYWLEGIQAALYVHVDGRNYDNPHFIDNLKECLRLRRKTGIPMQLIPMRPTGSAELEFITGMPFEYATERDQGLIFEDGRTPGGYVKLGNNEYAATIIDERFLELIKEEGIHMCHHNPEWVWCGGCLHGNLRKSRPREKAPKRFEKHKREKKIPEESFLFSDKMLKENGKSD